MSQSSWYWEELVVGNRDRAPIESSRLDLYSLHSLVCDQAHEIKELRMMLMAALDVLDHRGAFHDQRLLQSYRDAKIALEPPRPPPPPPPRLAPPLQDAQLATDPYRGLPAENPYLAKQVLAEAQRLHYAKYFREACELYQKIVETYPETKESAIAMQQLENLRDVIA